MSAQNAAKEKSCAQCDLTFKKSQRSLGCQLCAHWFCLDCAHVTSKIYDLLRNEPTKNLPFNCDGCVRILPKLTEFGAALRAQSERIVNCEQKVSDMNAKLKEVVALEVEKAIQHFQERESRKCNIVLHNIPEPPLGSENPKEVDANQINAVFQVLNCEDIKATEFVRMGMGGKKARLIKVQLKSVADKHKVLGNTKKLRAKSGKEYIHKWSNVFITPDLTKEEREKSMELKKELEKRRKEEKNDDLVISRGKIVERKRPYEGVVSTEVALPSGGPAHRK